MYQDTLDSPTDMHIVFIHIIYIYMNVCVYIYVCVYLGCHDFLTSMLVYFPISIYICVCVYTYVYSHIFTIYPKINQLTRLTHAISFVFA